MRKLIFVATLFVVSGCQIAGNTSSGNDAVRTALWTTQNLTIDQEPYLFDNMSFDGQGRLTRIEVTNTTIQNEAFLVKSFEYSGNRLVRVTTLNTTISREPHLIEECEGLCTIETYLARQMQ